MANPASSSTTNKTLQAGFNLLQPSAAWALIFVVLMAGAYFDSTAPLAAAFAWLILVAAILANAETLLTIKNG